MKINLFNTNDLNVIKIYDDESFGMMTKLDIIVAEY